MKQKQDYIERINCEKAGEPGHHQCGVCQKHKQPRITCGCLYFKDRDE